MNKTTVLITTAIAGLIVVSGAAFACGFGGFPLGSANNTAIEQAIVSNNYAAWKDAIVSTLTEDNFNKTVQHYNLMTQMNQIRSSISSAMASGNYTAYQQAVGNLSSYMMSQDRFNAMVARYNTTNVVPTMGYGMMRRMRWR